MINMIASGLLIFSSSLSARTWTVDASSSQPADFRQIQDAVDAAGEGGIILVASVDQSLTLAKRVTIKGPGFDQVQNGIPGGGSAVVLNMTVQAGADGSRFEGLSLNLNNGSTSCNRLVIIRCKGILDWNLQGDQHVVSQCFSNRSIGLSGENCRVQNSAFLRGVSVGPNGVIDQCVIGIPSASGFVHFGDTTNVTNSIITRPLETTYTAGYIGNCLVLGQGVLPAGNGNLTGGSLGDIFVATWGSFGPKDAHLALKEGSPAIGAASGGGDLGIFGGEFPYVLSGIPASPRITLLVTPVVVPDSTGLTFEVRAEARD